jgi:uncharacterized membrane protein
MKRDAKPPAKACALAVILVLTLTLCLPACCGTEKIRVIMIGAGGIIGRLSTIFDYEPLVYHDSVIVRVSQFNKLSDQLKVIRLYFPRTYEKMKTYDLILLVATDYNLLTNQQDKWIYDAIREGAGGINDGGMLSVISPISTVWANSLAQQAFPNDAPLVDTKNWRATSAFRAEINRDHPDPILTPFIPYNVEEQHLWGEVGMVIHRQGSRVLAWQVGNFATRTDYLVNWEYEQGRTMTSGQYLGELWFGYPTRESKNQYSMDMFMNMIFWLTERPLIDDIDVFHRVKSTFEEFRSRLGMLISLRDFIDKFGANTQRIQVEINNLEESYRQATDLYLDSRFIDSENAIKEGLDQFPQAEDIARREKDTALLWVYIIEWLVTSSALFISGFILWTLMVRRRLYRQVEATRLQEVG